MDSKKAQAAIEAILFTMGDAVEIDKLSNAIEMDPEEVVAIVEAMINQYEAEERGIRIVRIDDAYQMCTNQEMYEYLIRIAKQPKKYSLTDVMLETLSIIAYKQPITRLEIEKIRGVSCSHAVNRLLEYNLIEEVGRLDAPGRPLLFATTQEFLRTFGVTSLEELPSLNPEQVEEFKKEAEDEISAATKVNE